MARVFFPRFERRKPLTVRRITSRVKYDNSTGCWNWTGSTGRGYGHIRMLGRNILVHRSMWFLITGKHPGKMCVCHRCDNRLCCSPMHLFLGTYRDNTLDAFKKGRRKGGEGVPNSVLKETQVLKIIRDNRTNRAIGEEYGVSRGTVSAIRTGQTWSFLTGIKYEPAKK
jgi:hypothetical protein